MQWGGGNRGLIRGAEGAQEATWALRNEGEMSENDKEICTGNICIIGVNKKTEGGKTEKPGE